MTRSHLLTRNKQLEKAMELSIKWGGTRIEQANIVQSVFGSDDNGKLPHTRKTQKIVHYFFLSRWVQFLRYGRKMIALDREWRA